MIKRLFVDTETTGLDYKKCGLHQISGFIEIDDEIKETFDIQFKPFDGCIIEDKTLETSHLTKEDLMERFKTDKEAYIEFRNILLKYVNKYAQTDKLFIIGYNVNFDKEFISELFLRNDDNYLFSLIWGSPIDVMSLYAYDFQNKRHEMINFKLMTVAEECGFNIKEENFHDAFYDIKITYLLFHNYNIKKKCDNKCSDCQLNKVCKDIKEIKVIPPDKIKNETNIISRDKVKEDFVFDFGKYKDKTIGDVILEGDYGYLRWVNDNKIKGITISEDILK